MATLAHSVPRGATFSALRHANFRLYFGGQLVSMAGTWMQAVAQGWLVFQLTHSELALGLVACASGVPSLVLSPFAGVVVDRFPRRMLLLLTQTIQMALAFVLTLLVFSGAVQVWHIILLAFVLGITNSVDAPARQSFIKDMVGGGDMSSAITLNSMMMNGARVVGPGVAGIMLASLGAGWCFFFNGVSFLAAVITLLIMAVPFRMPNVGRGSALTLMREGLAYSQQHVTILPLLLLAAIVATFAVNVITLLPAYADTVLHSPVDGLSILSAVQGVGAVLGALFLAALCMRYGRGRITIMMLMLLSVSMILVAFTTQMLVSAVLMGVIGFSMVIFFVNVNTMIQNEVPDNFRGRVMSLYTLTFMGLTPFGAMALGVIAEQIGTPVALALYGLITGILSVGIVLRWRGVTQLA